jgi:hypothetical protein
MKKQLAKGLEKAGIKQLLVNGVLRTGNFFTDTHKSLRKKWVPILLRQRSKNGFYAIDFDSDWNGFGSRVIKTLEILLYCEKAGLRPAIRFNYREKDAKDKAYFREVFFYKNLSEEEESKLRFTKIWDNDELGWKVDYNKELKLSFAKTLFDKYAGIQPDILAEVAHFKEQWFKGEKALGVHYRGTDKAGEAPLVQRDNLLKAIQEELDKRKDLKRIFLSTDDAAIIHFLKNAGLTLPLIYRQDTVRSTDGEQFHRKRESPKTLVNRDAIVNCLLLSECGFLLKTASILSELSVVFNPQIGVRILNKPHSDNLTWWPLKEIMENAAQQ